MDYGKSGNPKNSKDHNRQQDPSAKPGKALRVKGSTKVPNLRPSRDDLLARIKAKADQAKA